MNSRALALVVAFAALAIVLNTVRIPTVFWPGFFYRLWEIPVVVAFLLFGAGVGVSVGVLNVLGQMVLFPIPAGVVAYPWGLVAVLAMLLGVFVGFRFCGRFGSSDLRMVFLLTFFGVLFRTVIMPFVDYGVYRSVLPLALGRTFTEEYVWAVIPASVAFNIIVAVYTVPVSYVIAKRIGRALDVGRLS